MTKLAYFFTMLEKYPKSLSPNEAHGFLTAVAIAPEPIVDLPWMHVLLGIPEQVTEADIPEADRRLIALALEKIGNQLLDNEFVPITTSSKFQGKSLPDTDEWSRGFLKVIALHPKDWEAISNQNINFARNILGLNIINEPAKYADLVFGKGVDINDRKFIEDMRLSAGPLAQSLFDISMEIDLPDEDAEDISQEFDLLHDELSADNLQDYANEALYDLLFIHQDRLPISVVEEFVLREPQMLPLMAKYTDDFDIWIDGSDDEAIWPLLHHIFILGKMSSAEAARQLMVFLINSDIDIYDERWDWLAGYWPALFGNKTAFVENKLFALASDRINETQRLYDYFSILLSYTSQSNPDAFETIIDLLADRLTKFKDRSLAYLLGSLLLDHPRNRHRILLEQLAIEQDRDNPLNQFFSIDEVNDAFVIDDQPEYDRFSDPWQFYDREQIIQRQLRWLNEDLDELAEDEFLSDWMPDYEPVETFIREEPKVGRNDPCPCGSGKKYKKCCLH